MSVEEKLDQVIEKLTSLAATAPVDISGLATSAEVNALSAKLDALAAVVGTEATPAPAPTPEPAPAPVAA